MGDLYTARVLAQLELAERHLGDQEFAVRDELGELSEPVGPDTGPQWQDYRQRKQFLLGQIEGLTRAQLILADRRRNYSQSHLRIRMRPDPAPTAPADDASL